jgi:hypothetical protein
MSLTPLFGIQFEELDGSPRITINQQGVLATRSFKVGWTDWQNFAKELIGIWRIIGAATQFVSPIAFPGLPNLIVSEVHVEPFQPDSPDGNAGVTLGAATNSYAAGGAKVTAQYRTQFDLNNRDRDDLPQVPDGTFLVYSAELAAEVLTIPGRTFEWVGTAPAEMLPDDLNPGILIPSGDFTLDWQRVLQPPWTVIRGTRGKVNSSVFLGAPAGCVLFLGAQVTRQFQFIEDGGFWQVEYRFSENTKELSTGAKVGWNYFYKETPVAGEHWVEVRDQSGRTPYLAADFTPLFSFGTT